MKFIIVLILVPLIMLIFIGFLEKMMDWSGEGGFKGKIGCFLSTIIISAMVILYCASAIHSCSNSFEDNNYYDEERHFRYHM